MSASLTANFPKRVDIYEVGPRDGLQNELRTLATATRKAKDLEIVFIDNGSTDGSPEMLEAAKLPNSRVVHESRRGFAEPLNRGLAESTGDLVLFLDADAVPEPGWIAAMEKALATADWLDVEAVAASAAHLAEADEAIEWVVEREWAENVGVTDGGLRYDPQAPRPIALRVVARIVEGFGGSPRGGAIARLLAELESGGQGNVAGVSARTDGDSWVFRPETPRRSG